MSEFRSTLNKKAVALKYDETRDTAPVIVASGMGYLAEKIVETANENGVPVYEDNSLATLLSQLELGSQVPEELYRAVVDIYLYFLNYVPTGKIQSSNQEEIQQEDLQQEETVEEEDV